MNKVDLMAVKKSEGDRVDKVPDFIEGKVTHYPYGDYPKVNAGTVYGYATAYTPTAVMVEWDDGDRVHSEWFPAARVHRVEDADWHGKWMPF